MDAHFTDSRRSAFTLVELLVVVGLMAMLATISIAGYNAVNRGMADRGAMQSAVSTLRVAQQTCLIDRVPTKVMFFNQKISSTAYQGTAIAIKQAGRITIIPQSGNVLVDEFADWNQSYPVQNGSDGEVAMRLFRMKKSDESKGIDGCSTKVRPCVTELSFDDYLIQAHSTYEQWCQRRKPGNNKIYGFGGDVSGWKVGDPYGIEIARVDLPKGYVFGTDLPKENKLDAASVPAVAFDPEDNEPSMSANVPISLVRPAVGGSGNPAATTVGTITPEMLKDTF